MIISGNGDIDFGGYGRPTVPFIASSGSSFLNHFISFALNADNVFEGQETGLVTIALSTAFDGFVPRFQSVRIIIHDSNGECITKYDEK